MFLIRWTWNVWRRAAPRVNPAVQVVALHHETDDLSPSLSLHTQRPEPCSSFTSSHISCCFRPRSPLPCCLLRPIYPSSNCSLFQIFVKGLLRFLYFSTHHLLHLLIRRAIEQLLSSSSSLLYIPTSRINGYRYCVQRQSSLPFQPLTGEPPRNQQSCPSDLPWPLSSYHPHLLLSLESGFCILVAAPVLPDLGMQRQQPNAS